MTREIVNAANRNGKQNAGRWLTRQRRVNVLVWLTSHLLVATAAFHVGYSTKVTVEECPPCDWSNYSDRNLRMKNELLVTTLAKKMRGANETLAPQLPPTMKNLIVGMGRVHREEFARLFDVGVPLMPSSEGNQDVLLLYSDESSLPSNQSSSASSKFLPRRSPEAATEHCLTMNMILLKPGQKNHCVALMGQWPSPVVYKWMRAGEGQVASFEHPLQLVSRSRQSSNTNFLEYPDQHGDGLRFFVKEGLNLLQQYLFHMDDALVQLKPLAAACANPKDEHGVKNTVIVMLCSHGQSEFFLNFVCSARARGLDTSQVLLFATDVETKQLAEGMGITTFYDDKIFGKLPVEPSKRFGDYTFKRMMLAKVYCLYLVSQLRYDILFQDSDVIWYRHPLEFFASPLIGDFDIYVQDDGSRSNRNEAYHANGGFFYIRNNKRTSYFLSVLARQGDFILKKNEQIAMNVSLNDHAALTGLRVKTLNRDDTHFMGGWHFHHQPDRMERAIHGNFTPYIFHMSWTSGKVEKLHYLEQMGLLLVSESCIGTTVSEILPHPKQNLTAACCVAEPIVRCHYSNKPSKVPCDKSPPIG